MHSRMHFVDDFVNAYCIDGHARRIGMREVHERLRGARERAGYTKASEAAEAFGWAYPTYVAHENGSRGVTRKAAEIYAAAFRVSPEWLLFGGADRTGTRVDAPEIAATSTPGDLIPIYNVEVSAGHGALVDGHEEVASRLVFPPGYLRSITTTNPRHLALLNVRGDSMSPTLSDGDVVMVDTSRRDVSLDGLYVLRDGGEALLVKRLGRGSRRGYVSVISDNRHYPSTERPGEEIDVIGRVIWIGAKV